MAQALRRVTGFGIGIAVMLFVGWLLVGTVTLSGIIVPRDLDDLNKVAEAQGDAYSPPSSFLADCVREDNVGPNTRNQIKTVTGEKLQSCNFLTDARQGDAIWGALAAVAVIGALGGLILLAAGRVDINLLILVMVLVVASLLGAWIWPRVDGWLDDLGVIAEFFWRGFGGALVVLAGAVGAHEAHRGYGHD